MSFQERAKDAIRSSGGRVTPQRALLLDLLAMTHTDLNADRLHQLATQQDPNISLPTVYRTLRTLEDARLVTSRFASSNHERKIYHVEQHDSDTDAPYHFTCRACGRVIPFQSEAVEQLKQTLSQQLDVGQLTLCMCAGGLCSSCREKENETMTLDQLQANETATVRRISGKGAVRRRLMDMGLVRGSTIERVKAAPMGDPVEYLVRGYHLSLRQSEAQLVEVEK